MKNKILYTCLIVFTFTFSLATLASASASDNSEYTPVDPYYLATHIEEFYGQKVRTNGTMYIIPSTYMYEDFWLEKIIPVVIRFAELPMPKEGEFVTIYGTIEHSTLEGGFYYLKADSYTETITPEIPSILIAPIFMIATLLILILHRKNLI